MEEVDILMNMGMLAAAYVSFMIWYMIMHANTEISDTCELEYENQHRTLYIVYFMMSVCLCACLSFCLALS